MTLAVPGDEPSHRGHQGFLFWATDARGQSWQVALISLACYIPLSLAIQPNLTIVPSVLPVVLGAVAAYAVQWLLLALARVTIIRPTASRPHAFLTALVIIAAITAAGVIVTGVANAFSSPTIRALSAAEGPAAWLGRSVIFLIVTSIWSAFAEYRAGFAKTRALTEQLTRERQAGIDRVQQHRDEVVGTISRYFADAITSTSTGNQEDITILARERLRPLSHELALTAPPYEVQRPEPAKPAPWRAVIDEVTRRPVIRPLLMAAVVTFLFATSTITPVTTPPEGATATSVGSTVSVSVDLESLLWSLGYLVGIFIATWVIGIVIARSTRDRLPGMTLGRRLVTLAAALLAMAIVVQLVIQISYVTPGFSASAQAGPIWNVVFTFSIFVIALLILSARLVAELFVNVTESERDLNNQLAWEIARANETLAQERRHLASALHGPVQSAAIATGMTLNEDIKQGTPIDEAWNKARERLTDIVRSLEDGPSTQRSLEDELRELQGTWDGLCTIETDIPATLEPHLSTDWIGTATICDLLVEAVGNAAMHGRARNVSIRMRETDDALIHLSVNDDGTPSEQAFPDHTSTPGLGSITLDQVAVRWHRDMTPSGTTLDIWLPRLVD